MIDNHMIDYALQHVIHDYPAIEGSRWFVRDLGDGSLILQAEEPRRGYKVQITASYINPSRDISRDRTAMQAVADRWNTP